ncbi:MAG: hypothetical protein GKR87_12080 [Kiritimatiellae bacterium]|nr:hypothetical protein [Kiritimatiellia bacterium]
MIKLNKHIKVKEIRKEATPRNPEYTPKDRPPILTRPEVVDAKVYKLKSAFVKNAVFITLSYVKDQYGLHPVEIFINSKDLTRAPEYVVLTRLISAIFRKSADPMFILEELRGICDPNGGSFKQGKYYHSFYAEIADAIERFFLDVGIIEQPSPSPTKNTEPAISTLTENTRFQLCPECSNRTLKTENGCDMCIDEQCGYSKCDK